MSEDTLPSPLSVTILNGLVKQALQANFPDIWVVGETSDIGRPGSGHIYFSLKDDHAVVAAVIWKNVAQQLRTPITPGVRVLCRGSIDVYPPRGTYQLIVRHIEPLGEGALQQALLKLRTRLAAEGLFDSARKRPLPEFPRHVVVITSPSGAAIHDFLQVAARRWRSGLICILPTRVQGDAAGEIAAALKRANLLNPPPDVLVLTRGGGSLEDLWCFNEEVVVRAIHASRIPVVSAIGHEVDWTLSDLVADVRALTPSEAAERVFPSREDLLAQLLLHENRLRTLLRGQAAFLRSRLQGIAARPVLARPRDRLREFARRLDELETRGRRGMNQRLQIAGQRLAAEAARLDALSPLGVLARGYSITTVASTHELVRDAVRLRIGDQLEHRFASGQARSTVTDVDPTKEEN